jgi:F-type H+-transporting ATPase subunit a
MRWKLAVVAGTRQTYGEMIYDIAQTQVAETGLPTKAIGRWFPYVATLLIYIFVVNLLGFIPLPLTGETYHGIPVWGIYAATSSISVTLALALMTWLFQHIEGIRYNGVVKYFKSWIPEVPKPLLILMPIEISRSSCADQPLRPSLREHARRPHPDPHDDRPGVHHPHPPWRFFGLRRRSSSTSSRS